MTTELALVQSEAVRAETAQLVPDAIYQIPGFNFPDERVVLALSEVADAFGVGVQTVRNHVDRHKTELTGHGYRKLGKADANSLNLSEFLPKAGQQVVHSFPPTAVMIVGMLLTDSPVAAQFRTAIIRKLQAPAECKKPHLNDAGRKRIAGKGTPFIDQLIDARMLGVSYLELPSGFKIAFDPSAPVPNVPQIVRAVVMAQYNEVLGQLRDSAYSLTNKLKSDITEDSVSVRDEALRRIQEAVDQGLVPALAAASADHVAEKLNQHPEFAATVARLQRNEPYLGQ